MISKDQVFQLLKNVLDPELNINLVDLGLIYDVTVTEVDNHPFVKITMTLTTPGCPLGGTIESMVKDALFSLKELNVDRDINIEVTFDPPWTVDMMSEEARAELGMD